MDETHRRYRVDTLLISLRCGDWASAQAAEGPFLGFSILFIDKFAWRESTCGQKVKRWPHFRSFDGCRNIQELTDRPEMCFYKLIIDCE